MRNTPSPTIKSSVACSIALFRLFLLAYPASFRRAYGAEMLQVFRESCRQADQERGLRGTLSLWLPTFTDVLLTALAERYTEGKTMTRQLVIRLCGLLTLIGAIPFILLTLDGEVVSRLIPGYAGLLNGLLNALPQTAAGRLVGLGIFFFPALCFVFGLLGLWLLQRSWLGKIVGGLAFLGPIVCVFLWLFIHTSALVLAAFVLLGVGLLLCGILTIRYRLLPRWNALPLLLSLCLGAYSLRFALWELIPPPNFLIQHYAFFATIGYLLIFSLWGCLGYIYWARKEEQSAQVVPITSS